MLVRRRREGQGEMSTRGGCQVRSVGGGQPVNWSRCELGHARGAIAGRNLQLIDLR
jgi:hypothetical protein